MQHSPAYSPVAVVHQHHTDASRPSLGFPLGTALLLIVIFSLSGIFSCCYHWDKFRSLRQSYADDLDLEAANRNHSNPDKPINPNSLKQPLKSVTVIMPGDNVAKFIALPCPCDPSRPQKQLLIPKPPRFPVPLY